MAQIRVEHLTFNYEGSSENVFEDASFSIDTCWRLGLIGRNGKGKTTLLRLFMGDYVYRGLIDCPVRFDYFPYIVSDKELAEPASELMEGWKPGCELWRILRELERISLDPELLYRPFGTLSHGERTRLMLAVLFSEENEFLLIDEPTDHLDAEARIAVRRYLLGKRSYILVSHDRELLDACTDHVLVLNRDSIEVQTGNFSSWEENKRRLDSHMEAENEKHLKEIKKLSHAAAQTAQWADRNEREKIGYDPVKEHDRSKDTRAFIGAKTRKLQSRVRSMEKRIQREITEKEGLLHDIERPVPLKMNVLQHHKQVLLRWKELELKYQGADEPLFAGLTGELRQGQRLALSGPNGCGKSSLIRHILRTAGQIRTEGNDHLEAIGECQTAAGLIISHVSQDTSGLRGDLRGFAADRGLDESLFFSVLRQFDLGQKELFRPMEEFSAGQKKKVLIAASLITPAHLFIWDEPLNYIDVFCRMQIEELILSFRPTMLFVEHDARFCERVATNILHLGGG